MSLWINIHNGLNYTTEKIWVYLSVNQYSIFVLDDETFNFKFETNSENKFQRGYCIRRTVSFTSGSSAKNRYLRMWIESHQKKLNTIWFICKSFKKLFHFVSNFTLHQFLKIERNAILFIESKDNNIAYSTTTTDDTYVLQIWRLTVSACWVLKFIQVENISNMWVIYCTLSTTIYRLCNWKCAIDY